MKDKESLTTPGINADLFNALYDLKTSVQALLKMKNGKLLMEHNVIKDGEALEAYQELKKAIVETERALQGARK